MLSEVKIVVFSYLKKILQTKRAINNRILIVFSGGIGDAIIFCESFVHYIMYCKTNQIELVLLSKKNNIEFYKAIGILEVTYLEIDTKRFCIDWEYYSYINKFFLNESYDIVVAPQPSKTADLICMNAHARNRYSISDHLLTKNFFLFRLNRRFAYNKMMIVKDYTSQKNRYSKLCDYICHTHFHTKESFIKAANTIKTFNDKTIVIAPATSTKSKNWEARKFADVINYCHLKKYRIDIIGICNDENYIDEIISKVNEKQKINKKINLSMEEWIEAISNACLVIGSDSASIHLATALKVESICILSGRTKDIFFPKRYESTTGVRCVQSKEMPCFGCFAIADKDGYGNKKCRERILEGKPGICVQRVLSQDVIVEIENWIIKEATCTRE